MFFILRFHIRWEMWALCLLNQELAEARLQNAYSKTKINSFVSKMRPVKLIWEVALCCCTENPAELPSSNLLEVALVPYMKHPVRSRSFILHNVLTIWTIPNVFDILFGLSDQITSWIHAYAGIKDDGNILLSILSLGHHTNPLSYS